MTFRSFEICSFESPGTVAVMRIDSKPAELTGACGYSTHDFGATQPKIRRIESTVIGVVSIMKLKYSSYTKSLRLSSIFGVLRGFVEADRRTSRCRSGLLAHDSLVFSTAYTT